MISMPQKMWQTFKERCHKNYKSASSVIRELIISWSEKNEREREERAMELLKIVGMEKRKLLWCKFL
jgi:Arc/MetJ-type ribon-helix-helix transcriptional regulator